MAKGTSGFDKGGNTGVLDKNAPTRTIEAVFREARGFERSYYKSEVLEAVAGKDGELKFEYATPESREKGAKTNRTQYLTYKLKSGAKNGEVFGINWDKVSSVSGQTYNLRDELKRRGYRWDGTAKKWVKK